MTVAARRVPPHPSAPAGAGSVALLERPADLLERSVADRPAPRPAARRVPPPPPLPPAAAYTRPRPPAPPTPAPSTPAQSTPAQSTPDRLTARVPRRASEPARRPAPRARSGRGQAVAAAAVAGSTLAVALPLVALIESDTTEVPTSATTALQLTAGDAAQPVVSPTTSRLRSFSPVAATSVSEAEPATADAESLLKAVGMAEIAQKAAAAQARAECALDLSGLGRVKPWVSSAAKFLSCLYDEPDLIGVAGRGRVSDHPLGLALDLMTRGAEGDRIAECALRNREALGISYVIWKQRINYGSGWQRMENRGNETENHFDHVHISFEKRAGSGSPDASTCS